ncbi:uncharacterized protein LOC129593085 [Paramacrobiotus metropolitanus]|uniref:uncharacterized protein LOC129593085 n=1 Tax=Paramacrobiotus metropolitanus TaxID=2943436 RepID=UPI0024456A9F|nr:uncharacterized protein LOC129593085 [Paramacrobiotus metropolitanus]
MSNGIHRGNSVDVVVTDGVVRYGRVVDTADNGFFVDLFCPTGRRRFFPFGSSVFLSDFRRALSSDIVADAWAASQLPCPIVEVLMRESLSGPWTWFPAEMVMPPRSAATKRYTEFHVAVVRWGNNATRLDIVPVERIRLPIPKARWAATRSNIMPEDLRFAARRVGKWTFVKRSVKLPDEFASMPVDELRTVLHSNCAVNYVTFVEFRNECLYFLKRVGGPPTDGDHDPDFPEANWQFRQQLMECFSRLIGLSKLLCGIAEETDAFRVLPPELWLDVFSQLDTMTQTTLRAVCSTWNQILGCPLLTTTIVIAGVKNIRNAARREYRLTAPLFKYLRSTTQRLIVVDWWNEIDYEMLHSIVNMMRYVAENNPGIRLKEVSLVGFHWILPINILLALHEEDDCGLHLSNGYIVSNSVSYNIYDVNIRGFVAIFRGLMCDSIRLIGGTVSPFVDAPPYRFYCAFPCRIRAARLMVDDDLERSIWDVLELALPIVSDAQRETVSEVLAWVAAQKNASPRVGWAWNDAVCKVLCAAQAQDPRPQSHFRGKKWCLDGLHNLPLDKLSRITLHFLMHLASSITE